MFVTHCRRVLCVQVFNFGPEGPPWMPPPGTRWQLVEDKTPAEKKEEKKEKHPVDKKADNKDKKPAEKKEEKKEKHPVDKKADNKDNKPAEKKEKHPVGDHTTPLIILFM